MYQANEKFEEVILSPNRALHARLVENDQVIIDNIKNFSMVSGNTEITMGSAIASYIEVTIEAQDLSLSGREVTLQTGLEVDGIVEYVPMGLFTIQNPKKESNKISFTAYDRLTSKCNAAYYSKLTYPVDALDILTEIEAMAGIEIDKTGLSRGIQISKRAVTNDSEEDVITTEVNPFDGYTYKETIGFVAGLFGSFAVCSRTGKIQFRWYTNRDYKIRSNIFYSDLQEAEEKFSLEKIVCDTAGETIVSGDGATGISMQNPVMTKSILDTIVERVKGLQYAPAELRFIGDIRLDIGDIVTVVKNDNTEIQLPAISIQTFYDGGLMQTISSYGDTTEEDDADTKGPITDMVERVSYDLAFVKTLMVDNFTATNGAVKNLSGDFLNFKTGEFEMLKAKQASFENLTAENFSVINAKIDNIDVENLSANYARIDFANVNTANIRKGFMENLMVSQGIFTSNITAAEGTFTNYLTGVNILANNITAGTLSVERLVITGSEESIVYELNKANDTLQLSKTTVDGGSLTDRTITAEKIVASSITGNEIAGSTITGQHIIANSITANELDVNSIFAQDITATGTITGANLVGATGSFSGNITSENGTIAGWTINDNMLHKQVTETINGSNVTYDVIIQSDLYDTQYANPYNPVFGVHDVTNNDWTFLVRSNGQIETKKLYATGGAIGGFTINTSSLYYGFSDIFNIEIHNAKKLFGQNKQNVSLKGDCISTMQCYTESQVISDAGLEADVCSVFGSWISGGRIELYESNYCSSYPNADMTYTHALMLNGNSIMFYEYDDNGAVLSEQNTTSVYPSGINTPHIFNDRLWLDSGNGTMMMDNGTNLWIGAKSGSEATYNGALYLTCSNGIHLQKETSIEGILYANGGVLIPDGCHYGSTTAGNMLKWNSNGYIEVGNWQKQVVINGVGQSLLRCYRSSNNTMYGIGVYPGDGTYYAHFHPTNDNKIPLGHANQRWTRLYAANASISTSDARLKENIQPFDERYETLFDKLEPVLYSWKNYDDEERNHNRRHSGYISQSVKQAMEESNLEDVDFGGFCYDDLTDDSQRNPDFPYNDIYSLAYEEFIALNTHMIQKTRAEMLIQAGQLGLHQTMLNDLKDQLFEAWKEIKKLKQALAV